MRRKRPVVLVNCTAGWRAQAEWSLSQLLGERGGKLHWRSDLTSQVAGLQQWRDADTVSGSTLQTVIASNGTIRVFDPIGTN